jgi:glycine/D-amino acid oxidase-like deaminating enzyme/nitrite reductase/ring-hydroxylating ferredoxin subunit
VQPGLDETRSLWLATAPTTDFPTLDRDVHADVAVLGGGITGIVTALLLRREGLDVVVVDQSRVGTGVTGYTTAKVSSLHGLTYARLRSCFGDDGARTYGEANEAGLARIAGLVEELGIRCDFRRRPNYTYAASEDDRSKVEEEVEAAAAAGLPASFVEDVPLPFPTAGAIRFEDQAELQPTTFLVGVAEELAGEGGRIFEQTRALRLRDGAPCRVETTGGTITAEHVVVATHFPFPDRGLFFARMHPERSYCVAARGGGPRVEGMFISASPPTRSIRSHPVAGEELLIVGGEGHKVGQDGPTAERYGALEDFARERFDAREVAYRWSTQDNLPADGVPFVGKLTPRSRASYTATGFRKWGLAMGVASAEILTDAILGRDNPWRELFDPNRLNLRASATDLVKENANAGFHFFADRLTRRAGDSAADLAPGEGRVVSRQGRQIAVSKDEEGRVHAVSARCTHLACIVAWNDAERTWDCPCHGSRFARDGSVLQGPAVNPLDHREAPR